MRLAACLTLGMALVVCAELPLTAQPVGQSIASPVVAPAVVSFQFDRVGLTVPRYTLQVHEDGTGSYQAEVVEGVSSVAPAGNGAKSHVERTLTVTPATAAKIFKTARRLEYFNIACASKAKNIADSGTKTLSYLGADGKGSCVYNYSENKGIAMLTDTFMGIAFTLDEGRRLEFLRRYDRLGLDAEMDSFAQEVDGEHALELGTIAPTLTAIASDMELMQRVRLRAAKMLDQIKATN